MVYRVIYAETINSLPDMSTWPIVGGCNINSPKSKKELTCQKLKELDRKERYKGRKRLLLDVENAKSLVTTKGHARFNHINTSDY